MSMVEERKEETCVRIVQWCFEINRPRASFATVLELFIMESCRASYEKQDRGAVFFFFRLKLCHCPFVANGIKEFELTYLQMLLSSPIGTMLPALLQMSLFALTAKLLPAKHRHWSQSA